MSWSTDFWMLCIRFGSSFLLVIRDSSQVGQMVERALTVSFRFVWPCVSHLPTARSWHFGFDFAAALGNRAVHCCIGVYRTDLAGCDFRIECVFTISRMK